MPFPIVGVVALGTAATALPYLLYGKSAYVGEASPSGLGDTVSKTVNTTLEAVHQRLVEKGGTFSVTKYVWNGKSCVEAAADRGAYLAGLLTSRWTIHSYTVGNYTHTFNMLEYQKNFWIVDSYVIVYIKCLGATLPADLVKTPQSTSLKGTAGMDPTPRAVTPTVTVPTYTPVTVTKDNMGRILYH
ncbi:hypothetical protein [Rhodospira trueperi]|uniref:Uncharacterized protein n=1 Tax=Rhodospira trueperi TaxID=69960 RepID=A0A1G7AY59_9PROT|nr:hypothetical protein [Rhodospira trueperi]SDE19610.1 hypothetical protein SAMN05421720_104136 [Rhodospira trueperi]